MDGVLYDSMPGHARAWSELCRRHGIDAEPEEFFLYEGMTGVDTVNLLYRRTFGKEATLDEARTLYKEKSEIFNSYGAAPVMPGAVEALQAAKQGGAKIVLVTGSAQKTLLSRLEREYPGMFSPDLMVTALDVIHGKPSPEPYLQGMRKAGATPVESIVVENAPLGVKAGASAGAFVIAVTTGPVPEEELRANGASVIAKNMYEAAEIIVRKLKS